MSKTRRARFVALADLLARRRPDVDPQAIGAGQVLVDGRVVANPAARVRGDAALRVTPARRLRGDIKLSHTLDSFPVAVAGRVALDVGASAGGFTTALLDRGARRVYAVDAGVGQLLGRLRADPRVVNLEGHNLAALDHAAVPDAVEIIAMDLSYLGIADAVPQLERVSIGPNAEIVALVKPTFELRRPGLAASDDDIAESLHLAAGAIGAGPWTVLGTCDAPRTGQRGAREAFVHARRRPGCQPCRASGPTRYVSSPRESAASITSATSPGRSGGSPSTCRSSMSACANSRCIFRVAASSLNP